MLGKSVELFALGHALVRDFPTSALAWYTVRAPAPLLGAPLCLPVHGLVPRPQPPGAHSACLCMAWCRGGGCWPAPA